MSADEPLTPRQHYQRALREKRERQAALTEHEYDPAHEGWCYLCRVWGSDRAAACSRRMAPPAPPLMDFSPFREHTWGAGTQGGRT